MPIYEYECQVCGKKFEMFRSISDDDNKIVCPRCGCKESRRIFSAFSTGSSGGDCAPGGYT